MANRHKGEVSLDVDGTVYTMALTLDAMVALEDMFSTPDKAVTFDEVITRMEGGSARHLRGVLWAVLQLHHRELSVADVSPLVQAAGGINVLTAKFMELVKATQPDKQDLAALGVAAGNPPAAQGDGKSRGTTARSTSTRAVSA